MARMYYIEDDFHGEHLPSIFHDRDEAIAFLERLAEIPWGKEPNRAPCTSGEQCHREYYLCEGSSSESGYTETRTPIFMISAKGVVPAGSGDDPWPER